MRKMVELTLNANNVWVLKLSFAKADELAASA